MVLKNFNLGLAISDFKPINASVRVGGSLGTINVTYNPINFTKNNDGLNPSSPNNPKKNYGRNDIAINLDNNNVFWHIYINGTNMRDNLGHYIPVNNISFNSTCSGGTGVSLTLLSSSSDLQLVCKDIPYNMWANVSFYLTVPPGQYNNTYNGNITIYVNGTSVENEPKNRTLNMVNNTTAVINQIIEISWGGTPIDFGTANPLIPKNATDSDHGWPANVTSTSVTNVFIDLYLNGTDFTNSTPATPFDSKYCSNNVCSFKSNNVTYSNASTKDLSNGPQDWNNFRTLNNNFYYPQLDFQNWGGYNFTNRTTKLVWWNITIPMGMPVASYSSNVIAKAVNAGVNPNVES